MESVDYTKCFITWLFQRTEYIIKYIWHLHDVFTVDPLSISSRELFSNYNKWLDQCYGKIDHPMVLENSKPISNEGYVCEKLSFSKEFDGVWIWWEFRGNSSSLSLLTVHVEMTKLRDHKTVPCHNDKPA